MIAEPVLARPLPSLRAFLGVKSIPSVLWIPAALVGAAMVLPLAYLLARAFGGGEEAWDLIFRARTAYVLGRTVLLAAIVSAASIVVAVPLAWLTVRTNMRFRRLWAVLVALPLVIPTYVGAFLIISTLGPKGLLQQLIEPVLGIERLPSIYGLPGAALTLTLLSFPYVFLTVRGVLADLDPSMEESARSLGHGSWSVAKRVTLPLLRPAIAAGSLLVALYTLSDFGAVSLMRYETFTWAIYQQYQTIFDRSVAAAMALILVLIALAALWGEAVTRGRLRYYGAGSGSARRQPTVDLGRWDWAAQAFCASVALASLALPMAVLAYWLIRGVAAGEEIDFLWAAARNSALSAGLAAAAAAVFAVPVAVVSVRYPGVFSRTIERASHVGYALPGLVVALALVFFASNYARFAYQTVWVLVFAYVVLHLPAALGAARASLSRSSPRLEEAARGLGRSPMNVLLNVTLPIMRPGVLAGAALVFLISMKELPATLILGPIGFETLATHVWSASSEAFFARAAAPALLLILMSSVPMALLVLRGEKARP